MSALQAGFTPLLRADRLAEQLGIRELWIKNDAANPTHSFKDRVVSVALTRARELGFKTIACASTGNLANAVAAHAAAVGLESYVFIPHDLEEPEGPGHRHLRHQPGGRARQLRTTSAACATELSAEHDWAFVNINMRPYYAEGSKTLAFEIAEQLNFELPDRIVVPIASGSLFTKIARGFDEWIEAGLLSGQAPVFKRRPGRRLLARGHRVPGRPGLLPPGQAEHDRQVAGHRQPGRRALRAGPGPPHRRLDRQRQRRRGPRGHPPAGHHDRHLPPRPPAE